MAAGLIAHRSSTPRVPQEPRFEPPYPHDPNRALIEEAQRRMMEHPEQMLPYGGGPAGQPFQPSSPHGAPPMSAHDAAQYESMLNALYQKLHDSNRQTMNLPR